MNNNSLLYKNLKNLLLTNDVSLSTTEKIIENVKQKYANANNKELLKQILFNSILEILERVEHPIELNYYGKKPQIILLCGVNGVGKTTIIARMSKILSKNKKITIGGCDTFRAAASIQLSKLVNHSDSKLIIKNYEKEKPASVTYRAYIEAQKNDSDILLIDTAGRMHNKTDLMNELLKITKVLKKFDNDAPHNVILVIDANNGQNAKLQIEFFSKFININGIIISKLDCCANGGIIITIADEFSNIPIHALNIGPNDNDLFLFNAKEFLSVMMDGLLDNYL